MTTESSYYTSCTEFLQQGDIFRQDVVCPVADTVKRIFRSTDGRHGSVVFSGETSGQVFSEEQLNQLLLASAAKSKLHTSPFSPTEDGQNEFVISNATLYSYSVVATQTCDVSGKDKDAHHIAVVLPVRTFMDICRTDRLPFSSNAGVPQSIERFIVNNSTYELDRWTDPMTYPSELRRIFAEWSPSGAVAQDKNRLQKFLNRQGASQWQYVLPPNEEFGMPASIIDFTSIYSVPRSKLLEIQHNRVARLGDPYRDQFAQSFASTLSRIAVPVRAEAEKF